MIAEVEVLIHVDDVVLIILVFTPQHVKDLYFHKRLVVKPANKTKASNCIQLSRDGWLLKVKTADADIILQGIYLFTDDPKLWYL